MVLSHAFLCAYANKNYNLFNSNNNLMKTKRFLFTALAAAAVLFAGCDKYDDSALRDKLDDHEQRITDLESAVEALEGQIEAGALISGVAPVEGGWRISFTGGDKPYIDILDGEDTGRTPLIEVKAVGDEVHIFVDGEDTGIDIKGASGGTTPHIGPNGNWFIGPADTGVRAEGPAGITPHVGTNGHWWVGATDTGVEAAGGAEAFVKFDVAGDAANGNVQTVWYTTDEDKAGLTPSAANGWTALFPIASGSGPVAMIADNRNGTVTITLNDAAENAPEPATAFTFAKGSTAVHFEILNYGESVDIGEDGTGTLRFLVNPSSAWIPTTGDGGIGKWYLNNVVRTRAPGYVDPSTDFRITKIELSPNGKGEYIATIAELDGGEGYDGDVTLVLDAASAKDTEPVLISSPVFSISGGDIQVDPGSGDEPGGGPTQSLLFYIEHNDQSQYAFADETLTDVGEFIFYSSVAWKAEVVGVTGPDVSWLRLKVNGEERYSGSAGDNMPVVIELDRNYTGAYRVANVIFSPEPESWGVSIRVTVWQRPTDRDGQIPEPPAHDL
jgi:outer membrane murein-binding lipoprotein Lpp